MRALVMYESSFGNTRDVAEAIGEGLAEYGEVDVADVGTAATGAGVDADLLIVGGPTHAFGLSRPGTRQAAAKERGEGPASEIGLREWLADAGPAKSGATAAAFDTKIDKPIPGSAAHKAEKLLRRLGYRIVAPAENFRVADTPGPLRPGEIERARSWGARLGMALTQGPGHQPSVLR